MEAMRKDVHPEDIFEKEIAFELIPDGWYDCVVHDFVNNHLVCRILEGEFADRLLFVLSRESASVNRGIMVRVKTYQIDDEYVGNVITGIKWPKEEKDV